ncbi:DUF6286 domain-containing protein [Streptomyces sp. JJ36]|uniref:DUF6286 domain-containing protein n=1 Tax=Streptomyces sp. JJ36 TaxID=2736645 RepID=UPI001F30B95E|nr:DUF6286 domain-containing protein [Streptomyces sp. JJ36]MCF6526299.1 hypothetical protein [Streptomyces sp. JJ36]
MSDEHGRDAGGDRPDAGEGTRPTPTLEKNPGPDDAALEQSASAAAYAPRSGHHAARAGRFWSTRRVPAGIVAAVLLAVTGLFLYDIVSVRADRPGMAWRRTLADELATRPLDDPWVLTGASVAAALGLWLLLLAATPGLRPLLAMRRETPQVRAALDRAAAALVLRDRAMEVPGVQTVRVRVRRRRVRVRAVSHFRELDVVRAELDEALEDGLRQLDVARRPGLAVHVRRPAKG